VKSVLTILLTLLYTVASAGVSIKVHYCGKHFSSVSLFNVAEGDCCCKTVKKKASCCTDKDIKVSIKEVQKPASSVSFIPPYTSGFIVSGIQENTFLQAIRPSFLVHIVNSPPPPDPVAAFLANCCFRI
jgi:hypothetical protein